MKILKLIYSGCILLLLLIISGCIVAENQNIVVTNTIPTITATTQVSATHTLLPTLPICITPTVSKTNTRIRPTSTPTPTAIPFTFYPTLDSKTYQQKINEWYENQENCAFPCLWDFDRGKTDILTIWETVHEIMPYNYCRYESNAYTCGFSNWSPFGEYKPPEINLVFTVENGDIIRTNLYGDIPNKSLNRIINDLGFPDEAYLFHLMGGEGYAESSLLLIYNEFHAVLEYYDVIQMTNSPSLNFCINDLVQPSIDLYREGKQIRFEELPDHSDIPYRVFSDVIGVSFSDYYQNNILYDGTLCIKSNKEDWR